MAISKPLSISLLNPLELGEAEGGGGEGGRRRGTGEGGREGNRGARKREKMRWRTGPDSESERKRNERTEREQTNLIKSK